MSDETNKNQDTEEWEYEYVELPDGEDLTSYNGYEYIEVSGDDNISWQEKLGVEEIDIEEIEIEEVETADDFEVVEVIDDSGSLHDVIEIPYDNSADFSNDYNSFVDFSMEYDDLLEKTQVTPSINIEEMVENKNVPVFTDIISKPEFLLEKDANVSWYCDNKDIFVKISSLSLPPIIEGTERSSSILIKVLPTDDYGWSVVFGNGLIMDIKALQAYQCKNGAIPDSQGTICCGTRRTSFRNIKRIVLYETPQYVAYNK